jgi:hypothetical protein
MIQHRFGLPLCLAALVACTSGRPDKGATWTVGGTVTGLAGTGLVLQNNQGDDLAVTADGPFTFATPLLQESGYRITVKVQPTTPPQTCTVVDGSGVVDGANVSNANVACVTDRFAIGGIVTNYRGSGLVLTNGDDELAVTASGLFTFPTKVVSGGTFDVAVKTQPESPSQHCVVSGGSGTVVAGDVTGVAVHCDTNSFSVGGEVSGLAGTGLVLSFGESELLVNSNGPFGFPGQVGSGESYAVTIAAQPSNPAQTCLVAGGTGVVGNANVTSVRVSCTTNAYPVGGTVSGLTGSGLVLLLDNDEELPVSADGPFTFPTPVPSGRTYRVTVGTQPGSPAQVCTVERGAGTIFGAAVTDVDVVCAAEGTYAVGGTVSGLAGSGLVLQLNGGGDLAVPANGAFRFAGRVATGASYAVTVLTQPSSPLQSCTVQNGAGTMGGANVTSVTVACVSERAIGGTVSGLAGSGLVLRNGAETLPVSANGPFTFATRVAVGGSYSVSVETQPTSPAQVCAVAGGSGVVANASINGVAVTCVTGGGGGTGFTGSGPGGSVPDSTGGFDCQTPGAPLTTEIEVPATATWAVAGVTVTFANLTHQFIGDLRATLTHVPSGRTVTLFDTIGGLLSGDPFECGDSSNLNGNYSLVDTATRSLGAAATEGTCLSTCDIPSGDYQANSFGTGPSLLSAAGGTAFGGVTAAGAWRLTVYDQAQGDTGSFTGWTLALTR